MKQLALGDFVRIRDSDFGVIYGIVNSIKDLHPTGVLVYDLINKELKTHYNQLRINNKDILNNFGRYDEKLLKSFPEDYPEYVI